MIEVGDTVYKRVTLRKSHSRSWAFFVPVIVTKTTKTQLTCADGTRAKKDNMKIIGGGSFDRLYVSGQKDYGRIVTDETSQYNTMLKKLSSLRRIEAVFEKLYKKSIDPTDTPLKQIMELETTADALLKALESEQ